MNVVGDATDPQSPGVLGAPLNAPAQGIDAIGVKGDGGTGFPSPPGVPGVGRRAVGVLGVCADPQGDAVEGHNTAIGAQGFIGGKDPRFNELAGVYGESAQQGVMGLTTVPQGTGVYGGGTMAAGGDQIGVRGETVIRDGVLGQSFGSGNGVHGVSMKNGVFGESSSDTDSGVLGGNSGNGNGVWGFSKGGTAVGGQSDTGIAVFGKGGRVAGRFEGDVEVTGDIRLVGGADVAEDFSIVEGEQPEPGTVMVLNAEGSLRESHAAYDRRVAGVLSGAGGYRPGLILDKQESKAQRLPVALVGKAYCKVDAQYSRIEVGDLLTTSPTPGHAMKADDPIKAFGAVIGKALSGLPEGRGMIPILVTLQ
jgi:hypothetical protein